MSNEICNLHITKDNLECLDSDGDRTISWDELSENLKKHSGFDELISDGTIGEILKDGICDAIASSDVLSEAERNGIGQFSVQSTPGLGSERCGKNVSSPPMS